MSWFRAALGGKEDEENQTREDVFHGSWTEASEKHVELAKGLSEVINFAVNTRRKDGGYGVRASSERMVFQMNSVLVETEVGEEKEIGDYEIEVRRVR